MRSKTKTTAKKRSSPQMNVHGQKSIDVRGVGRFEPPVRTWLSQKKSRNCRFEPPVHPRTGSGCCRFARLGFADSPVCQFTGKPVRRFAGSPVHRFASSPARRFTGSPIQCISILNAQPFRTLTFCTAAWDSFVNWIDIFLDEGERGSGVRAGPSAADCSSPPCN